MKSITKLSLAAALGVVAAIVAVKALAQTSPTLTITALGTNSYNVTLWNGDGSAYALEWTPVLDSADYPWTVARLGTNGQTNFFFNGEGYDNGFFRALLSTNTIPPWELADPNNPSAGILTVTIDSPANGATIR
ncbi:MAG: hypothetical protein ACRED1_15455 [Limisphaerales bacterium]